MPRVKIGNCAECGDPWDVDELDSRGLCPDCTQEARAAKAKRGKPETLKED